MGHFSSFFDVWQIPELVRICRECDGIHTACTIYSYCGDNDKNCEMFCTDLNWSVQLVTDPTSPWTPPQESFIMIITRSNTKVNKQTAETSVYVSAWWFFCKRNGKRKKEKRSDSRPWSRRIAVTDFVQRLVKNVGKHGVFKFVSLINTASTRLIQ